MRRLDTAVMRGLQTKELQEKLGELGYESAPNTPEQYAARMREEVPKWGKVVRASGVKSEVA